MKTLLLSLASLTLLSGVLPAQEMETGAIDPNRFGTLSFYLENDAFCGTDENYTNGALISWTSPALKRYRDDANAGALAGVFDDISWTGGGEYERHVAISLGQAMYTPVDVANPALLPDQRPYAGWLYVGLGIVWQNTKVKNSLMLSLGVVGPWSYAEETQRFVHKRLGQRYPQGWDNQLGNEIGINLAYEKKWRLRMMKNTNGLSWDALPYVGAALGNVNTSANAGTEIRFGYNLPDDFGTGGIAETANTPSAISNPAYAKPWKRPFGMHVFARAEGRAVLRNIFLDGNTFRDSTSVDKYPFVADLSVGAAINWKNTKLTYALVYRTKEFDGQQHGQMFGSVTLSFNF